MIQGWLNLQMWNGKYRGTMDMEELCLWRANYKLASFQLCRGLVSLTPVLLLKGQLLTYNENARREKEEIWETIMTEDFLKLMPDTKPQIEEAQRTPNRIKNKTKQHNCIKAYNIRTTEKSKIKS